MAERAVMLAGIGGQGIQLAARTLAVAAVSDGLQAMMMGEYGGMMRGGNSDATVVLGTQRLLSPPTVSHAWGAVTLHHEFWAAVSPRVLEGGIVIVDRGVFQGDLGRSDVTVVEIDATNTAIDLGSARSASMVALGALSAATGIVGIDALMAATAEVLPPYRSQHAATNAVAVRAGFELVDAVALPAWADAAQPAAR